MEGYLNIYQSLSYHIRQSRPQVQSWRLKNSSEVRVTPLTYTSRVCPTPLISEIDISCRPSLVGRFEDRLRLFSGSRYVTQCNIFLQIAIAQIALVEHILPSVTDVRTP